MKERTSITLSKDLLGEIDPGSKHSRSAFIEWVLRKYLRDQPCTLAI
jgi:metal-responsive CopG/Arc/MetJ family transcriptional regulator